MPAIATASVVGHAYGPADKIEKDGKTYAKVRFWTKDKVKGQTEPEFTSWSAFVSGKPAEWMLDNCRKGSLVFVSGTVRLSKWTNKDGKETYTIEFTRTTEARVLDGRDGGDPEQAEADRSGHEIIGRDGLRRNPRTASETDEPPF